MTTNHINRPPKRFDFSIKKIVLHSIQPSPCPLRRRDTTVVDCPSSSPLRDAGYHRRRERGEGNLQVAASLVDYYYEEVLDRRLEVDQSRVEPRVEDSPSSFNTPYRKPASTIRMGHLRLLARRKDPTAIRTGDYIISEDSYSHNNSADVVRNNPDDVINGNSPDDVISGTSNGPDDVANSNGSDYVTNRNSLDDVTNRNSLDDVIEMANNTSRYNNINSNGPTDTTPEQLFEKALEGLRDESTTDEGFWTFDRTFSTAKKKKKNWMMRDGEDMISTGSTAREQWREDYTIQLPDREAYVGDCPTFQFFDDAALYKLADSLRRMTLPIYNHLQPLDDNNERSTTGARPSSENFHLTFFLPATPTLSSPIDAPPDRQATSDQQQGDNPVIVLSEEIVTQEIVLRISSNDKTTKGRTRRKQPYKDEKYKRTIKVNAEDDASGSYRRCIAAASDASNDEFASDSSAVVAPSTSYKIFDVKDIMETIGQLVSGEGRSWKEGAGVKVSYEVTQIRTPSSDNNSQFFTEQMKNILMIDM